MDEASRAPPTSAFDGTWRVWYHVTKHEHGSQPFISSSAYYPRTSAMKLATLAACAGTALAFADTAAFYSSHSFIGADSKYITKSADVGAAFLKLTSDFCVNNPDEKLVVFRVKQLSRQPVPSSGVSGTFLKHVHYGSSADIDLDVASECSVSYFNEVPPNLDHVPANVIVVDIDDPINHSAQEFLTHEHVVVQGKPTFTPAGSNGFINYLGEKLHIDELLKRNDDGSSLSTDQDENSAASSQEVEDDFSAAKSMIAAQENDATVTALSDDSKVVDYSGSLQNRTSGRSNLFTNYQFFTPGVWSALIVSFFLVFVASTAVGWITSIELSYKSFDKQVEFEKKTE